MSRQPILILPPDDTNKWKCPFCGRLDCGHLQGEPNE